MTLSGLLRSHLAGLLLRGAVDLTVIVGTCATVMGGFGLVLPEVIDLLVGCFDPVPTFVYPASAFLDLIETARRPLSDFAGFRIGNLMLLGVGLVLSPLEIFLMRRYIDRLRQPSAADAPASRTALAHPHGVSR